MFFINLKQDVSGFLPCASWLCIHVLYSATCPMLPTQYNIFLPHPKKGKGYTEEERKERKKDNLFSQQHTMQYIRSMSNQNNLTYIYKKVGCIGVVQRWNSQAVDGCRI
jgi:hypothetical protein